MRRADISPRGIASFYYIISYFWVDSIGFLAMTYKFQNCMTAAIMGKLPSNQINGEGEIDVTSSQIKGRDMNKELLMDVIYGASMGSTACKTLMGKTSDPELLGSLGTQLKEYEAVRRAAEDELRARGEQTPSCAVGEVGLKMGVHMNTMADASSSHIAEMMIEGATMGIIDATRARNRCPDADPAIHGMAQHLIDLERGNIEDMEKRLT